MRREWHRASLHKNNHPWTNGQVERMNRTYGPERSENHSPAPDQMRGIRLGEGSPAGLALGAITLAQIGETDHAKQWALPTLATDPDDPGILYNLACA
jgi:hypothetical protein